MKATLQFDLTKEGDAASFKAAQQADQMLELIKFISEDYKREGHWYTFKELLNSYKVSLLSD